MSRRLETLDSLRGLAALSVAINHCLIIQPLFNEETHNLSDAVLANLLKYTPLRITWAGHEAVMLFFVLSGFVLSLPYFSGRSMPYAGYLAKRFCRIYIPCLVAVSIGILLRQCFVAALTPGVSRWMTPIWRTPATPGLFVRYILLGGEGDLAHFDPVLWSLVHEIRISILLPFLAMFVLRQRWQTVVALSVVLYEMTRVTVLLPSFHDTYMLVGTASYVPMFLIGAVLAKYRKDTVRWYSALPFGGRVALIGTGVFCYTYPHIIYSIHGDTGHQFLNEPLATVGAASFIIAALATGRMARALQTRPTIFLGRISYSLYLYHAIVLVAGVHLFSRYVPPSVIGPVAVLVALPVSALAYYAVEAPSIRWAKRLSEAISPMRQPAPMPAPALVAVQQPAASE